jgi:L-serine dehydratase
MKQNKLNSIFDILGPIMIGPSSSHTAGAVRIGLLSKSIINQNILNAKIILYNSFAETSKGHGTDKAILAGLLGMDKADENIKFSFNIAKKQNLNFSFKKIYNDNSFPPNTVQLFLSSDNLTVEIIGVSLGGGLILIKKIDGFEVNISGEFETIIITHKDRTGILSFILNIFNQQKLNIVSINSVRHNKIEDIKTVITVDQNLKNNIYSLLKSNNFIKRIRIIHKLKEIW